MKNIETTKTSNPSLQEDLKPQSQQPSHSTKPLYKWRWILLVALITVIAIILPAGGYFFLNSTKEVVCTLEAKICPDGSSVGRIGPKCEFAKCPTVMPPTPTCRPRPACLDSEPRCMIPETDDMCPKTPILKITEYDVQIKLSDQIKDAYYINTTASKGYVYLKVHSLDSEPQCLKDDSSTAALSRVGKEEINPMTGEKYSESFKGKVIGDYYYYIDLAQYSCAETVEGKENLKKVRSAFTNAEITQ